MKSVSWPHRGAATVYRATEFRVRMTRGHRDSALVRWRACYVGRAVHRGPAGPGNLRTRLAPEPDRVRDLEQRFEQLWERRRP